MTRLMVAAEGLNFRSSPNSDTRQNILVTLSRGHPLEKVGDADRPDWIEVTTVVSGEPLRGFVNGVHTAPVAPVGPVVTGSATGALKPADRGRRDSATRWSTSAGARTFGIGEAGVPGLPAQHARGAAAGILALIDWLDVGQRAHGRWWPAGRQTFCNIYAYDVCTLSGAYLPRVWWTDRSLQKLRAGQGVEVRYADTVRELNANALFDWLEDFGAEFGWSRHFQPDDLQAAANDGRVAIICAQRTNQNRSGHINIVAPEHGDRVAKRSRGVVTAPLQSNAGLDNFTYGAKSTWWKGSQFRAFGFWSTPAQ